MYNIILNISVSCYRNVQSTLPKNVNLLSWLKSDKHREKVEQIRELHDEGLQKKIKATLPAITPSGLFGYRDAKHLIEHTGLLSFDIDLKDNAHISNFDELKEQVSHITSVAYCGLSVRGHGLWGLVPIPRSTPEIHRLRFVALKNDFKQLGINIDITGSDVCRLRIYSWDPQAYYNHQAQTYYKLPETKPHSQIIIKPEESNTRNLTEAVIAKARERQIDMTKNYKEWFQIAAALANTFGDVGRNYFHAISQLNFGYNACETDYLFDRCLKHRYRRITLGTFFHIANEYGLI